MAETWTAASAFAGVVAPVATPGAGLTVTVLDTLGLASVHVRKDAGPTLAAKVKAAYGIVLPERPQRVAAGEVAFVGTGPGAWMAVSEAGAAGWADRVAADVSGLASVNDQSDGYAALRLEGPAVLDVLAKGVFLDLHDSVFPMGSAAGVTIAHIGAILWRREAAVFEVLVFRSYAASFWQWVEESAAEYGLAVVVPA
jgi:sarcosine oxidase subunit gamma